MDVISLKSSSLTWESIWNHKTLSEVTCLLQFNTRLLAWLFRWKPINLVNLGVLTNAVKSEMQVKVQTGRRQLHLYCLSFQTTTLIRSTRALILLLAHSKAIKVMDKAKVWPELPLKEFSLS